MENLTSASSDADAALYAALEQEYGDTKQPQATPEPEPEKSAVEPSAKEPEPAKEAAKEPPKQEEKKPDKPPLSQEELATRYKNLQGALAESRGETKALKESFEATQKQFQALQEFLKSQRAPQQAQPQTPEDAAREFLGNMAERQNALDKSNQDLQKALNEQREQQQLGQYVQVHEQQFAAQTPDYMQALAHLQTARDAELRIFMPDDQPEAWANAKKAGFSSPAEYRASAMRNEAMQIARYARANNVNPAELFYNLAKTRGYATPVASPVQQQQVTQPNPLETIKKGMEAAQSLSGGGATKPAGNEMTQEDLAELFLSDPDKAEKAWADMKAKGLLG